MPGSQNLHGIIPPLLTPMAGDEVDTKGVERLINHVIEGGVHGVFVAGTTGEFSLMSDTVWHDLVRETVTATRQRVPVLAGVTKNSTQETIRLANAAADLGADYVVSTTPSYFRHTQQELHSHFTAIAKGSPVPLMLYNIPQNTGNALEHETLISLSREPNIVGLKDSSGKLEPLRALQEEIDDDDFRIFLGTDALGDLTLALGAHGTVPSIANLVPSLVVNAWGAAVAGESQRSSKLHTDVAMIARLYKGGDTGSAGEFVASLRYAMKLIDLPVGDPMLPIGELSTAGRTWVEDCLKQAGLLPN